MGGHYGTIHVRTQDADAVRSAVGGLACDGTKRFYVAPAIGGWVTVYPENHGQDPKVSEALAAKLADKTLVHCTVYDDDVFAYWLFENGRRVDAYNSCPGYFGVENPPPRGGNAQAFGQLLNDPKKVAALQGLLDAERMTIELERQDQFAELLGLPNTAYAYEYLQAGETDGVRQWKKLVHVPDLALQKAAKKAAAAAEREEFKKLQRDGLLLVDERSKRTENKHYYKAPAWVIDPKSSDVMLTWKDHWANESAEREWLRFSSPHWQGEKWDGSQMEGRGGVQISTTGSWRAVHSNTNSQIDIWDARENRVVAQKKFMGSVTGAQFSADENWLFVIVHRQAPLTQLHRIALRPGLQDAVLTDKLLHFRSIIPHPDGRLLAAVDNYGVLVVIDGEAMRIVNQAWIKEKNSLLPDDLREVIATEGTEKVLSAAGNRMSASQAEQYRQQSARHFVPKEAVMACLFTPDGQWLICGTVNGLRVLDWNDVWQGPDMKKVPVRFSAEGESVTVEFGSRSIKTPSYVQSLAYDGARRRVLFSGQEGKISFLNLGDGRTGALLVQPGRLPVTQLALTSDRAVIVATGQRLGAHSNMELPFHFQIWSYPALCRAAGLEY